jgi:hypothetical protein
MKALRRALYIHILPIGDCFSTSLGTLYSPKPNVNPFAPINAFLLAFRGSQARRDAVKTHVQKQASPFSSKSIMHYSSLSIGIAFKLLQCSYLGK